MSVRRSGEEGGRHRTHGTVADGTKGHKRQRDSHAVLHMLRISVPSAYSGERLRSRISLAFELRDGTRDSVLAQSRSTLPVVLWRSHTHMQSCGAAALFEYFEYFVVSPSTLAVLHLQCFTCFADALAFRGRSLVLRKARRIS